jgi:transcriptional regulator with XRE-family HTH domain
MKRDNPLIDPAITHHRAVIERTLQYKTQKQIVTLRKSKGWSQQELAKRMGTTQAEISRLEGAGAHGMKLSPYMRTLACLACMFEVDVTVQFSTRPCAEDHG